MLAGRVECGLVASVSRSGPNDDRIQVPTVRAYALDCCYSRAVHTYASVAAGVIFSDKGLHRAMHLEHNSDLVHAVDVLGEHGGILKHLLDHFVPMLYL